MKGNLTNLNEFLSSLKQNLPVICNADHNWHIENKWVSTLRKIFTLSNKRQIMARAKIINEYLNQIEKIPILFSVNAQSAIKNEIDYTSLIEILQKTLSSLEKISSEDALLLFKLLKRKQIALLYRLESINGGDDKTLIQKKWLSQLQNIALNWKANQINLIEKNLQEHDLIALTQTSRYPLFTEWLLKDQELQKTFFEWTLRDKNPISPFVEFPVLQQQLVDSALNGRISRFGGDVLKIQKTPIDAFSFQKILTLPIEGKAVSLLDENLIITFRGNYALTLREIFQIFKDKFYKVGNLEFFAEGITNWNVHQLGRWNADTQSYQRIDLEQHNWWTQLPILEQLTKTQASKRYGIPLNGTQWIAGAKATRGTPSLDYEQTHAFMELAIPNASGKSYNIYNFGKFAFQFPTSFFNTLSTFCLNMFATIAYPDENIFYTQRQHGCCPFVMNQDQGLKLMELIKEDMIKGRNNNLVFQIESENCAKWLYEKFSAVLGQQIPDLFRMSLMKTEPNGFVGACFALMRKLGLSEMTQFKLLTLIHIPFGAGKGTSIIENGRRVVKTLDSHEFWKTSVVYLPALLVEKVHSGQLLVDYPSDMNSLKTVHYFKSNDTLALPTFDKWGNTCLNLKISLFSSLFDVYHRVLNYL